MGSEDQKISKARTDASETAIPARERSLFTHYDGRDVCDLIAEYPLAWVCAQAGKITDARLLPLLAQSDAAGRVTRLTGHMARRGALLDDLFADPRVSVLFTGPQGYVSPAHAMKRSWIPTWNYAQVRISGTVRFDPDGCDRALSMLTDVMERDFPEPWTIGDAGPRYRDMSRRIIAFDIDVDTVAACFKLGQDESPETLQRILDSHPDPALVRWMRRFSRYRTTPPTDAP